MHVVETDGLPIFVWGDAIDDATIEQARNLARLPFAVDHIALMPDAHVGYGMPIGGVLATEGEVIPHAVGLDIGCGVRAWKTGANAEQIRSCRDDVLHEVQRAVPQGFHWHDVSQASRTALFDRVPDIAALRGQLERAELQVGSLGGGNHFIELQVDPDGDVWAMVHSGSRNLGKQMAEHYDGIARADNATRRSSVPIEWGLAYLRIDSEQGREYLAVMDWCLEFAAESRRLMAESVQGAICSCLPDAREGPALDVHHNYAAVERHLGRDLVVHRKGAVRAAGPVLVPGSMGTASYLGEGLGNPESFSSCSHGAGRAMGRKAAMRALSPKNVERELEAVGVRIVSASRRGIAEEAPEAYKDIEDVMRWQRDLVKPLVRLTPIGVVKG